MNQLIKRLLILTIIFVLPTLLFFVVFANDTTSVETRSTKLASNFIPLDRPSWFETFYFANKKEETPIVNEEVNYSTPKAISDSATIAIVATAGRVIHKEQITEAQEYLEQLGYKVILGKHIFVKRGVYAGNDEERRADLQKALDDPKVEAIICARGGYGSLRTLQNINWTKFKKHPKWLVGFSDVTALHIHLHEMNYQTIHGVMPEYFFRKEKVTEGLTTMLKAISNGDNNYSIRGNKLNRKGNAEGTLIGGNLSMIYSLQGTPYELDTKGKILFIEDLTEFYYHLDRMMLNLKLSGKLKDLKGLIVGGFSNMKENGTAYEKSAYEIIYEHVKEYDYPVCFRFPAGHIYPNLALVFGKKTNLKVSAQKVDICN